MDVIPQGLEVFMAVEFFFERFLAWVVDDGQAAEPVEAGLCDFRGEVGLACDQLGVGEE